MRSMRSAGVSRMSQNDPGVVDHHVDHDPLGCHAVVQLLCRPDPRKIYRDHPHVGRHGRRCPVAALLSAADALLRTTGCERPVPVRFSPGFPRSFGNRRRRFASRRPASVCGCCNSQSFRNFRFFGNFRSFRGFRLFRGCFSPGRPGIPHLFRHGFERCAVVARDHQPVAQRRQPQGVTASDARSGSRHQRPCASRPDFAALHPPGMPCRLLPGADARRRSRRLLHGAGVRRAFAGRMSRLLVDRVCVVLMFHVYGSFASSSRILRGRSPQCLQHFMSTEYMRAMQ